MKAYPYPVATFHETEPAKKLCALLLRSGIPAVIFNETKTERLWFLSKPLAAVHVEVPQPYYLQARKLIELWDKEKGVLANAVLCPECHSSRIEFPQLTRKFVLPVLAGHLLAALRIMPREFYCVDCHHTWPPVPRTQPVSEPMWPLSAKPWRSKKV